MIYQEFFSNDIDECFSLESSLEFDCVQLSAGGLGFQSRMAQIGKLKIFINSIGQRIHCRDALKTNELFFSTVVESQIPSKFEGVEVAPDQGLVHQPQVEKQYVLEPGRYLDIIVEETLATEMGWNLSKTSINSVAPHARKRLMSNCESLTNATADCEVNSILIQVLRERVLISLGESLRPWGFDTDEGNMIHRQKSRASFELVKQAIDFMQRGSKTCKIRIADVAASFEVSERSLYNSFQNWLGIGPYEHHVICKLHEFRKRLIRGPAYQGKITRNASQSGFDHLGQLGKIYRRHFGESPSQTVRRKSP